MKINKKYLALAVAAGVLAAGGAMAASDQVIVNTRFDTALTVATTTDINFGILQAGTNGTFAMTAAGAITPSVANTVLGGTTSRGVVHVTGSATQNVTIRAINLGNAGGVTIQSAVCTYGGQSEQACSGGSSISAVGPGAGADVYVGVTIATDGFQAAGDTPAPTFDLEVVYS